MEDKYRDLDMEMAMAILKITGTGTGIKAVMVKGNNRNSSIEKIVTDHNQTGRGVNYSYNEANLI